MTSLFLISAERNPKYVEAMKKILKTDSLNQKSISSAVDDINEYLNESRIGSSICNRITLVMEELILVIRDACGEDTPLEINLSHKFNKPWIVLKYEGRRFDPSVWEQKDVLSDQILNNLDVTPVWSYKRGVNRITLKLPFPVLSGGVLLAASVALAVLFGACRSVIPDGLREFLAGYILSPVSDVFMRFLTMLAPFLIFFSILTGIAHNRSGSATKASRYLIVRYFIISVVAELICMTVMMPFFDLNYGSAREGSASYSELFQMVLDMVPNDLISPFQNGNMIHIVILAVFFGVIIRTLDNRVSSISGILEDLLAVFMNATDAVCSVLPVFIFTSLTTLFWENGLSIFIKLWKPLAVTIIMVVLAIALYVLIVSVRYRVSPKTLLKKISPSALIALVTASSLASFTKGIDVNRQLGIDPEFSDFVYPLSMNVYSGHAISMYIAIAYYMAETYEVEVSMNWFIAAAVVFIIMSYATPAVSGGTLVALGLMMNYLNIPSAGLAIAGTIALLLDFPVSGTRTAAIHLDMVLSAGHTGQLDTEVLRSDKQN